MKLLYINQIEHNAGWGFEVFLNESLIKNGIETVCIDYQKNAYAVANQLIHLTENFDAVLLERGCGYLIPLEILKAIKRPKFLLFTELVARNTNQHYLLKSGIFEHIFFRSLPCMDWVANQGWLNRDQMSLFLSAIDPKFHQPIHGLKKDIDILFVGTLLPRRQQIISELANNFSVTTYSIFGQDMVKLINRAKITLNIHGEKFLDTETRVYETLGCQGFLITEKLSPESPFTSKVHLVETENTEDLQQQLKYYLEHSQERDKIAQAGYQEIVTFHTFDQRAKQIKQVIEKNLFVYSLNSEPIDRKKLHNAAKQESYNRVKDTVIISTRKYLSLFKQTILKIIKLMSKK